MRLCQGKICDYERKSARGYAIKQNKLPTGIKLSSVTFCIGDGPQYHYHGSRFVLVTVLSTTIIGHVLYW